MAVKAAVQPYSLSYTDIRAVSYTHLKERAAGKKKLYYISAEFLIGKLLSNNSGSFPPWFFLRRTTPAATVERHRLRKILRVFL